MSESGQRETWIAAIFASRKLAEKKRQSASEAAAAPSAPQDGAQPSAPPPAKPARKRRGETHLGVVAVMAIVVGLLVIGFAFAQPVKAALGQALLDRSFDEARASGAAEAAKPWPWADIRPTARLGFPSLNASFVVLNNASGEALAWAPGHVAGTAALGSSGVSAIAAHRDTHFEALKRLAPGAPVTLETLDGVVKTYRVIGARIVDARRYRFPASHDGAGGALALSTCWPIGSDAKSPERLVVFAVEERA